MRWLAIFIVCLVCMGCSHIHFEKTLPDKTKLTADYWRFFNQKIDEFEASSDPNSGWTIKLKGQESRQTITINIPGLVKGGVE